MKTLKKLLKEQQPELAEALDRSWKIALEQWLPAIGPSSSSYNSYPHLRNIEGCLDSVLHAFAPAPAAGWESLLNPLEIYVLLASVLFHDIGRVREEAAKKRGAAKAPSHSRFSRSTIVSSFAELGIPTCELAGIIGDIALGHDSPEDELPELAETAISPYGRLRPRSLLALLVLADHMDDAYCRVVPDYVQSDEEIEIKGAFRREVLAVEADSKSRLVLTVLSHEFPTIVKDPSTWASIMYKPATPSKEGTSDPKKHSGPSPRLPTALIKRVGERLSTLSDPEHQSGFTSEPTNLTCENWLVVEGLRNVFRARGSSNIWPPGVLLAVVLSDLRKNRSALFAKREDMSAIGVSLADWLVEYRGHLYDSEGNEAIEVVLNWEYLEEVTKAMWRLTSRVFAQALFSHEELAAEVGDYDLQRIKLAARRLAILSEDLPDLSGKHCGALHACEENWNWRFSLDNGSFTHVSEEAVLNWLKTLRQQQDHVPK